MKNINEHIKLLEELYLSEKFDFENYREHRDNSMINIKQQILSLADKEQIKRYGLFLGLELGMSFIKLSEKHDRLSPLFDAVYDYMDFIVFNFTQIGLDISPSIEFWFREYTSPVPNWGSFDDITLEDVAPIGQIGLDDFISKNKKFEDYLHHDNKEKLLEVLHSLLDGKKGKDVAVILLALQELGIIYIGNRNELYKSMRAEFGEIGDNSGINRYMNHYLSNTGDIKKEVSKVMAMLEKSNI